MKKQQNVVNISINVRIYNVEKYEAIYIVNELNSIGGAIVFTSDIEYIDSEIRKFAKDTVCYELQPEHITGKLVNES